MKRVLTLALLAITLAPVAVRASQSPHPPQTRHARTAAREGSATPNDVMAPTQHDMQPLAPGWWWKYNAAGFYYPSADVSVRVTNVDSAGVSTVEERFDGRLTMTRQYSTAGGWLVQLQQTPAGPKAAPLVFDPPKPVVKLADSAGGDRWVWYRPTTPPIKETTTILETAPLRVFAGTFLATHVHIESDDTIDEWYAEHVGLIKRTISHQGFPLSTLELNTYSDGREH